VRETVKREMGGMRSVLLWPRRHTHVSRLSRRVLSKGANVPGVFSGDSFLRAGLQIMRLLLCRYRDGCRARLIRTGVTAYAVICYASSRHAFA